MKPFLRPTLAFVALLLAALPVAAGAQDSFVGRPVYSEPANGLQMPPGCHVEPPWRTRLTSTDLEVWVVDCSGVVHTWMLRRSVLEMVDAKQARLRFQIVDDRAWPGETAGDSASVQCSGRGDQDTGFVVIGAKWRGSGNELQLTTAQTVIRADAGTQKFMAATVGQVDCTRFPDREAMLRRLQKAPR
ncbi:MAG TPA: hypothetical protein VMG60_02240 [Burkholderiaceae bacterium]|nr:hypothetical protein [Burkholderiaceae bacterium]